MSDMRASERCAPILAHTCVTSDTSAMLLLGLVSALAVFSPAMWGSTEIAQAGCVDSGCDRQPQLRGWASQQPLSSRADSCVGPNVCMRERSKNRPVEHEHWASGLC